MLFRVQDSFLEHPRSKTVPFLVSYMQLLRMLDNILTSEQHMARALGERCVLTRPGTFSPQALKFSPSHSIYMNFRSWIHLVGISHRSLMVLEPLSQAAWLRRVPWFNTRMRRYKFPGGRIRCYRTHNFHISTTPIVYPHTMITGSDYPSENFNSQFERLTYAILSLFEN